MSLSRARQNPNRLTTHDTSTNVSPLTTPYSKLSRGSARPTISVPTGTVASRILYLQSLSSSPPCLPRPSGTDHSLTARHGSQDIRAFFGPPTSAKFADPAYRNGQLHEEPSEEKGHSFLESDKGRLKHDDSRGDRDEDKGFGEKDKDVPDMFGHGDRSGETPQEDIMPKRTVKILTVVKARAREYSQHAREALVGSITTLSPTKHSPAATSSALQCRPIRSSQHTDISNLSVSSTQIIDEWIRKAALGPPDSEDSARHSDTTTSTGHVLSFQQMYAFYGIEEPADFFSAKESEFDAAPRQSSAGKRKCCHICRWINGDIDRCSCCGHRLCAECEEMDPAMGSDKKSDGRQEFDIFEDEDDLEETDDKMEDPRAEGEVYTPSEYEQENCMERSLVAAPASRISLRRSPTSKQSPLLIPAADPSSILKELPILVPIAEPAAIHTKSSVIAPFTQAAAILNEVPSILPQPLQESTPAVSSSLPNIDALDAPSSLPSPLPLVRVTSPKKHSMVKDSPFVIADRLSSAHKPVPQVTKVVQVTGHRGDGSKYGHRSHSSPEHIQYRHDLPRRQLYEGSKAIEDNVDSNAAYWGCDDPGCRASHAGYRADRQSVSWESDATVGCDSPNCRATVTRHLPYHHTLSGTSNRRESKVADRVPTPHHSVSNGLRRVSPLMPTTHTEKIKFELSESDHAHPTAEIHVDTPIPLHSYDEGADELKFSVLWKQAMYEPSPYMQTVQSGHGHPSPSVHSHREYQDRAHQSTQARHEQSSYLIPAHHIPPPPPSPELVHLMPNKRSTSPSSSYHSLIHHSPAHPHHISRSAESTQCHGYHRSGHTDTDDIDGHASSRLSGESQRRGNSSHGPHRLAQAVRPSHPQPSGDPARHKRETERAASLPEVLSPAPKRKMVSPKWMSLLGAEEEIARSLGDLGQLARTRKVMEPLGAVVQAADGGKRGDVGRATGAKLERMEAERTREGASGGVVGGGGGGTGVDVAARMGGRSSAVFGELERRRRSDAPSPGSGEATDATAVTAAEQVEEAGRTRACATGRGRGLSVRVVLGGGMRSTGRLGGGGEWKGEGGGEIEGISVVVHLRGEGDVVLEVDLKGRGVAGG